MMRAADEATVLVVDDDEDMRTVFMLGLARDTLDRILRVARDSLGYDLSREVGTFRLGGNETPLLGRVDWQLGQKHTLTLRDSFISLTQLNDRVSTTPSGPGDFLSNGGLYQTVANSVAGSITSHLTASLTNELRLQWATEDKPRRMNPAGQFGAPVSGPTVAATPPT